ncbi:MAG: hypothetical protein LBS20_07530 [Prevotella sp.]|jgi:hypothetical protein|nr:hypothetical protein [Prevotella sp.]
MYQRIHKRAINSNEICIEALEEMLETISFCLNYQKNKNKTKWSSNINDLESGVLGLSATVLMLCIVDTIGSLNIDKELEFNINGKKEIKRKIEDKNLSSYFWILNTDYFGLNLSKKDIEKIYGLRCRLLHNSCLLDKTIISLSYQTPFIEKIINNNETIYRIHLRSFYEICSEAVDKIRTRIVEINPHIIYTNKIIDFEEEYPTT